MNGKKVLFEIIDKTQSDRYSGVVSTDAEPYTYITLKTKMLLKKDGDQLLFGEEMAISPGRLFGITLSNSVLNNYTVSNVE